MRIIDSKYKESIDLLSKNIDKLECVAKALMEREKLSGEEFEILFAGGTLGELAFEEAKPEEAEPDAETKEETTE